MQMKNKEINRWEKTREKGRKNFIWRRGVISWGLSTGVIWAIVMPLINRDSGFLVYFFPAIVIFPIGGYAWGYFMWKYMEKKYQQAKPQEKP